jgi:hypothetical protein
MLSVVLLLVKRGSNIHFLNNKGESAIDQYGLDRPEELTESDDEEAQARVLPLMKREEHKRAIIAAFAIEETWRRRKAFMIFLCGSGYMSSERSAGGGAGVVEVSRERVLSLSILQTHITSYL